jgi:hypothetical protein
MRKVLVALAVTALAALLGGAGQSRAGGSSGGGGCLAHHPQYIEDVVEISYSTGCTGHDEPELDPLSNAPGSARNLTWTVVLPSNNTTTVDSVGPTFWFGGTVNDPNSLFGQAFVELQFYPNFIVNNCNPNGAFMGHASIGDYTVCSPVWSVTTTGKPGNFHEPAAFNAMLSTPASTQPMVLHAGDTVTIHWFTTSANDGYHVTVSDKNTRQSGTIVLSSKGDGPLMPSYDVQKLGNALGWGLVDDAPNSFVWEIGHTSEAFTSPSSQFCLPGDPICDSYNAPSWAGMLPIQIKSVTFGDGSTAKHWAVVSDFGGRAEVDQSCGAASYGNPFCIYPWYTLGTSGFHYGVDYPDNQNDFGQVTQFQETEQCGGPFGPDSTYCATQVK